MTNILGPYYSPWHWRGEDEAYMRQLDPAWVNIHQPSARAIHVAQTNAPNARIMLRSWDIDDHNGDRKREMYADPKGAARKHLDMWKRKWDELTLELSRNNWRTDEGNWYISLVNEPDPAHVRQVVEYSLEAMRLVRGTMIRLGLVASSVGTFKKPSEGDDGWTQCIPLEKPINDGGHILLVHEYWQPEGPSFGEDGGNLAWRHHSIPLDVPILIRESGANGYIYQRHSQNDDAGWQKFMQPDQYAAQVKEYIEGCDQRVKGVLLYMLDFHSDQWWSFDTMPAMHQLLAIKDTRPQKASPFTATKPPVDVHLPSVIAPGPKPVEPLAYITARAGANIRSAPNAETAQILTAVAHGEQIRIVGVESNDWLRVRYGDVEGYMHAQLIGLEAPEPVPAPVESEPSAPAGVINPITALAFLQVESGNRAFEDGLLVIRFEVHRFKANLKNDALFARHFKFTPGNYSEQYWRPTPDEPWLHAHGKQYDRHLLLQFAASLNQKAAYLSIGMGLGQVMGENHARIGYSNPFAMFKAFSHPRYGVNAQVLGFMSYIYSGPALLDALRRGDWRAAVQGYNGLGQEHIYVPALEKARAEIAREIGA